MKNSSVDSCSLAGTLPLCQGCVLLSAQEQSSFANLQALEKVFCESSVDIVRTSYLKPPLGDAPAQNTVRLILQW